MMELYEAVLWTVSLVVAFGLGAVFAALRMLKRLMTEMDNILALAKKGVSIMGSATSALQPKGLIGGITQGLGLLGQLKDLTGGK